MSWTTKHSDKPSDLKRESILTLPLLELFPRKPSSCSCQEYTHSRSKEILMLRPVSIHPLHNAEAFPNSNQEPNRFTFGRVWLDGVCWLCWPHV